MEFASAIDDAIQRKMHGIEVIAKSEVGAIKAEKGVTLVVSNEDVDDTIRIIKSLENSDVLINAVIETLKHEIKRQQGGVFGMLLGFLGTSMIGNMLTGKGVLRALEGAARAGIGYNYTDHMGKIL